MILRASEDAISNQGADGKHHSQVTHYRLRFLLSLYLYLCYPSKEADLDPINLFDYELLARKALEPASWDYYEGGSDDEITLRANRISFERIPLRPHVLRDVSNIDVNTTVQGIS